MTQPGAAMAPFPRMPLMLTENSAIAQRDALRAQLSAAVDQYLARGGRIMQLPGCMCAPLPPAKFNSRTPKTRRREQEQLDAKIAEHGRALAAIGLTAEQALKQMRERWKGQRLNIERIEQLAALHGYAFGRGR